MNKKFVDVEGNVYMFPIPATIKVRRSPQNLYP